VSRAALVAAAAAAAEGKGKSRASHDCYHEYPSEYNLHEAAYPPRAHRSPATSYTSKSPNASMCSSNSKPLPALPSISPTQTIFGRSLGSQSTLVPPSASASSSSLTRVGYELCAECFGKFGFDHSLSSGVESPSSPTFPQTAQELAIARRSAPRRKGQLRHAFLAQVWESNGWQDVGARSHCRNLCSAELNTQKYEQGRTKYRIIAPGVERCSQELGTNASVAPISRSAEHVTGAQFDLLRILYLRI
jgi:hypothetical protein